jgi:hypothetical protein
MVLGDQDRRAEWGAVLDVASGSVEELRCALEAEAAAQGPSTFGSLPIEKLPLVESAEGRLYTVNFSALERRLTHGIFHLLSEGDAEEGDFQHSLRSCLSGLGRGLRAADGRRP